MATAANGLIYYEAARTQNVLETLTDSGDHKTFNSTATIWSQYESYTPVVRPNGITARCLAQPGTVADTVNMEAGTAYISGLAVTLTAAPVLAYTRAGALDYIIGSVCVSSAGYVMVMGTGHATAFSTTRGVAGGPPFIPVDSVEVCQIRTTDTAAAVIEDTEIFQIPGVTTEYSFEPSFEIKPFRVSMKTLGKAGVDFVSALPTIHTGSTTKKVFAATYSPEFTSIAKADAFVAAENTYSISSKQVYSRTFASSSRALGGSSFTAYLEDGITDGFLANAGKTITVKFFPDTYKTAYIIEQGKLGVARTFPVADQIQANCTMNCENAAEGVM